MSLASIEPPDHLPVKLVALCRNGDGNPVCGDKGGPYKNLCAKCKDVKREEQSAAQRKIGAEQRTRAINDNTFEGRANALVSAGRILDQRIARVKELTIKRQDELSLLHEAAEAWRDTCRRLARTVEGGLKR